MSRNSWLARTYHFLADGRRNRVLTLLVGICAVVLTGLTFLPKQTSVSPDLQYQTAVDTPVAPPPASTSVPDPGPVLQVSTGGNSPNVNAPGGQVTVNSPQSGTASSSRPTGP
jgi:hypothetical protein